MINLEWLRTFRAVYRTKSLSQAAEMLSISQPTVSQQISTLEAHLGHKLFIRKSKGVLETDEGKVLNTMISGSIETLEEVEYQLQHKKSNLKSIITIGISEHLYKTTLCHRVMQLGEFVHIKFGNKQSLIRDVEEGKLLYAIIPDEINTFDIICRPLKRQNLILVGTPDINLERIKDTMKKHPDQAEKMLLQQKWYAHDPAVGYIKLFWIDTFNRKRPAIIPNYIIPNEYELLFQQSQGSGLSIALEQNAAPFISEGSLIHWDLAHVDFRPLSLLANKKRAAQEMTEQIWKMLNK
ncbi:LysR family transcriptional regulator [bacterium SCSIO 12643]|nr:LysR family transcriptional regulator [bacterium SCSIO 12643]